MNKWGRLEVQAALFCSFSSIYFIIVAMCCFIFRNDVVNSIYGYLVGGSTLVCLAVQVTSAVLW